MIVTLKSKDKNYIYDICSPVDVSKLQEVVQDSINQYLGIYYNDLLIWSELIDYRHIKTRQGKIANESATISYHTQELTTWLESLTESAVNERYNLTFWR